MIFARSYDEVLAALLAGAVGVMPSDTVYGLVARAHDKAAAARLYSLKNREHKPGTIVAASIQQLLELGVEEKYLRRVEKWWPNALSVETPLGEQLAHLHQATGRQGLRVVAYEPLRRFLEQTGPLLTTSANKPGAPGAVTIKEAQEYFADSVDFYVDGGDLSGRPPSTLIRFTDTNDGSIEVVRPGAVDVRRLVNGR